jgi:uncharacterized protein YqjF (DUF2071 family)
MSDDSSSKPLMQAVWSEIVAINFQIDPAILEPRVPKGLELDFYKDETYVSLVAMNLKNVKMMGFPIPISRGFEELNLRFYVKRKVGPRYISGACFIKDYVPNAVGSWVLGTLFKSTFARLKMKRESSGFGSRDESVVPSIHYQWKVGDSENRIKIRARSRMKKTGSDTKVGFILNHNHEYSVRDSKIYEYRMQRPAWTVWDAAHANFECNTKRLFGEEFVKPLSKRPSSVFVAEGSPVTIFRPTLIS